MIHKIIKTYVNFYKSHNFRYLTVDIKQKRFLDKSPITITSLAASRINNLLNSLNPIPLGIRIGIRINVIVVSIVLTQIFIICT